MTYLNARDVLKHAAGARARGAFTRWYMEQQSSESSPELAARVEWILEYHSEHHC